RYYRDAKIMEIIEGTSQIHEIQIAMNYMMGSEA
ncbi:TPA: acyl-CoA dehydrogenase family protein, partial [Escherichia coli]